MAITKTTTVHRVDVIVRDASDYTTSVLALTLVDKWDDPEDDDLPVRNTRSINLTQGSDVSSYPQFVQDIATAVWGS
jgi:hypothetical protein